MRSFDFLVNNHLCLTALGTKPNAVLLVLKAHFCHLLSLSLTKFCLLRFYQPNLSCLGTFGSAHLLFQNVFAPYLHTLNTLFSRGSQLKWYHFTETILDLLIQAAIQSAITSYFNPCIVPSGSDISFLFSLVLICLLPFKGWLHEAEA